MADTTTIANLPTAGSIAETDYLILDQASVTSKITVASFVTDAGLALTSSLADYVKSATLAGTTGAASVGTSDGGTVQGYLTTLVQDFTQVVTAGDSTGSALIPFLQSGTGATSRTVQNKLRERVTPQDFGAVGDGTTDDTSYFTTIETAFKNTDIDLEGKTYLVTAIPKLNNYYNGRFAISKTTTVSTTAGAGTSYTYTVNVNAVPRDSAIPECVVERDARASEARIGYSLTQTAGLQGVCFDEPNSKIYAMYFDTSSGSEQTIITRYSMDDHYPAAAAPDLTTTASAQVGHQGLSIEYITNASPKLWSAIRYDATNYPNGGRQVMRFNVTDGAAPSNVEVYTLFGTEFAYADNSTMVAVSYDQRWVVATGRKTSRDFWIRVFDRRMLIEGGAGDYSNAYTYEFNVDCDILADDSGGSYTPIQNVACDGAFVYILAGNSHQYGKKLHQYSIAGKRIGINNTVSVGLTQSQTDGTYYEPEAIAFYKPVGASKPSLSILILTTGRKNYIFEMGSGPVIYSGSWTPTITTVTNATASTSYKCNYTRMDDLVTISGRLAIQATATGATTVRMTLPVPLTAAGSLTQAQGTFNDATTQGGRVQLDTTTGLLDFSYTASTTTNTAFSFSATYRITN